MADQFLRQLFSSEESYIQCFICLEKCGEMHPETGLIERPVRLPCQHIFGSGCISQWLQTNNTCPMCRQVFFPAESGPDPDELDSDDDELDSDDDELDSDVDELNWPESVVIAVTRHDPNWLESVAFGVTCQDLAPRGLFLNDPIDIRMRYLNEIRQLCDDYCTRLRLQPKVAEIVRSLFSNLLTPGPSNMFWQEFGDALILALSIYITSSLACQPRSPEEIAAAIPSVDHSEIRMCYGFLRVVPNREAMIDPGDLIDLRDDFGVQDLRWPEDWSESR